MMPPVSASVVPEYNKRADNWHGEYCGSDDDNYLHDPRSASTCRFLCAQGDGVKFQEGMIVMPGKMRWFYSHWGFIPVLLLAAALAACVPGRPAAAGGGYALPPSTQLRAAAYGNGTYVVTGAYDSSAAPAAPSVTESVVLTSPDGATWTAQPASSDGPTGDISFGNGIFVSTGKYNEIAHCSDIQGWGALELKNLG